MVIGRKHIADASLRQLHCLLVSLKNTADNVAKQYNVDNKYKTWHFISKPQKTPLSLLVLLAYWRPSGSKSMKLFKSWCSMSRWHLLLCRMDQETAPVAEGTEQSVRNIFEYSNIRIYWSQIFIRTFVRVNFSLTDIFRHLLVLN